MAGTGGFEPPNDDTKNRCLTTWRRPNVENNEELVREDYQQKITWPIFQIKRVYGLYTNK